MRHIIPHPLLSLFLCVMWLLLAGFTLGQFLIALSVALFASHAVKRMSIETIHLRHYPLLGKLIGRTAIDIVRSHITVIRAIFKNQKTVERSRFIKIPLQLKNSMAITFLAGILSITPGSAWIAFDKKTNQLTLHVFGQTDESYWHDFIKNRYETLLLEIFHE